MIKQCLKFLILSPYILLAAAAYARELQVQVVGLDNNPLADAVVYVEATDESLTIPAKMAVMDQQNKIFVPHVLAVPAGTLVDFPNTDSVNHYVYSFSEIKKFQFKLFKGNLEKHQMLFDKPGLVTLGCNIHDFMLGYIFVAPTPYVGVSDSKGHLMLNLPEKGEFNLAVWHERANENLSQLTKKINMESVRQSIQIKFIKALKPQRKMSHDGDDY